MTVAQSHPQSVDEFKECLYEMQQARKQVTNDILETGHIDAEKIIIVENTLNELCDARTRDEIRNIASRGTTFSINIQDEIRGLKKDEEFLTRLRETDEKTDLSSRLQSVDLPAILASYFPLGVDRFYEEMNECKKFLLSLIDTSLTGGVKPLFITDWDGTMKDYCSQYATNVQPVYSAVVMGHFARKFTRIFAVLTAGPLRRPGILDLTALPIDGPVLFRFFFGKNLRISAKFLPVFSGSWGREWWLAGKRVVHDDGVPEEGSVAIGQLFDELDEILHEGDFVQFALVGSGVQRKVDRLTLGVQTVFGHVPQDLSTKYIDAVKERIHRVDPNNQYLVLENCSPLEIEVCVHSSGSVWNKGDGVKSLVDSLDDSLKSGNVCVAGDTSSDVPMLKTAADENPDRVRALFVDADDKLKDMVRKIIPDENRVSFVSSPDVVHAAFASILGEMI